MPQKDTIHSARKPISNELDRVFRTILPAIGQKLYAAKAWVEEQPLDYEDPSDRILLGLRSNIQHSIDYYNNIDVLYKHLERGTITTIVEHFNKIYDLIFQNEAIMAAVIDVLDYDDNRKDVMRDMQYYLKNIREQVMIVKNIVAEQLPANYISEDLLQNLMLRSSPKKSRLLAEQLQELLEEQGVLHENIDEIIRRFTVEILAAKQQIRRPLWKDRHEHGLSGITAPEFLRQVHADDIKDDVVYKEHIRSIDKDLMDAVDSYVSQREKRGLTLGRAQGLKFVSSRPAPNRRPRARRPKDANPV